MPDWFYRTVSRPILFRLPAGWARDLALGFMGTLARLPLGPAVIDFLGHMRPDPRLEQAFLGLDFPTPVGLGPGLDTRAAALPALARFGFGFLEVGPVTLAGGTALQPVQRRSDSEALWSGSDPPDSLSLAAARSRLAEASRLGLPIIARLGCSGSVGPESAADECRQLIQALGPHVSLFSLALLPLACSSGWSLEQWGKCVRTIGETALGRLDIDSCCACPPTWTCRRPHR